MTQNEFKIKYPQYSHLEGDELDMMTLSLLESDGVLYADPNQVKTYLPPIEVFGNKVSIEDSSTTRWLNKKGELVRIGEPKIDTPTHPTESYRMEIIDFGNGTK